MWPLPCSPMIGSAACVQYRRPSRFTSIIWRHSLVSAPITGPSSITPALLTSTSRRPSSSLVRVTNAFACASSRDVGLDRQRAASVSLDALGELVDPVAAACGQRDGGAGARKRHRGRLADTGRGSGDRRYPAGEIWLVHLLLLSLGGAY